MLGDGSTIVTCLQRSAKGNANLPAPPPTSSSVVVGVISCARRLTSLSSVRRASALKKGEKGSQRSWSATPKADRTWCDCARYAATRRFQSAIADMPVYPPAIRSEAAYSVWLMALTYLATLLDETRTAPAWPVHRPRADIASGW